MSDGFTPASAPAFLSLAARLIRHAARGAPPALAERLEEEWLAALAAQPSTFAGLSFALGCCWATCVIARDHRAASAAVAASSSGNKTLTLDQLRSLSMSRFRWLWIAVGALAVTALLMFAAGELGELFFALVWSHSAYLADAWWPLAVIPALLWAVGVGLHQTRLKRSRDGGPGLPESRSRRTFGLSESRAFGPAESRPRGAFWLGVLVMSATSALCLVASAYCVFTTSMPLAGSMRWGMALFFAAIGIGLPLLAPGSPRVHRRHDGGTGFPGSGLR
jgi:hypothetical protein